jgi:glutathione S-transferase
MKLYYAPGSSASTIHMALRHLGLSCELEKVDLKTKTTESGKNFLEINYFGYVPVLELDSGERLFESVAILQYLYEKSPDGQGTTPETRAQTLEWFAHIGTELHAGLTFAWPMKDNPEFLKALFSKVSKRLEVTERYLGEPGREFVSFADGKRMGLLDIYLFGVLFGFSYLQFDFSPFPNLQAFFERMKQQEPVVEAMKIEGLM